MIWQYSISFLVSVCLISVAYAVNIPGVGDVGKSGGQGGKCGSFGWNLDGCECNGADAVCSVDPGNGCKPTSGLYNIAYLNVGRCTGSSFTQSCSGANVDSRLPANGGGWNEAFVRFDKAGVSRLENMISRAKALGFQAIEPDNTAELFSSSDLEVMVKVAERYGMKMVIKNENEVGRGNAWRSLLQSKPDLKKNIALILAEDCNDVVKCTNKYGPLTQMGIPLVMAGQNTGALAQLATNLKAAAMKVPARNAVGVTTMGKICVNGDTLTPGSGPTPEQIAGLGQGQQPFQQAGAPGVFGNGGNGNTSGGGNSSGSGQGGGSSGSGSAQPANYNPGANPWNQSDFNRLQPYANPSFLNPNLPLPQDGSRNPFASSGQFPEDQEKAVNNKTTKKMTISEVSSESGIEGSEYSDGIARLTCIPKNPVRGEKVVLAWDCGEETSRITSSDTRVKINTAEKPLGSVKLLVQKNTQFRLACGEKGEAGVSVCNVKVQFQNQTKSIPAPRIEPQSINSNNSNLCFFGFCL